ncbi:MAG TPA: FliH/SctL family protein [Solirubrobacteraceae bacterium]|nr:FliH/SctL family protein [Solirubrobacteraceae bacterium]
MSDAPVSYAFEQLEPSAPPPRDAGARMLAQASAAAEAIRERARAEGHAAGLAAGHEQGAAEIAAASAALAQAARGIEELGEQAMRALETDAIELALALAAKILAGALQARPELVVEVVQGALRRIADRRRITVLVNPADLEHVRAAVGQITSRGSGVELCEVLSEERVLAGSAVVRTAEGEVDASVHTQLERAREVAGMALGSTEALGSPDTLELGQTPTLGDTPDAPGTRDAPGTPDARGTPGARGTPDAPGTPGAPETPGALETPQAGS